MQKRMALFSHPCQQMKLTNKIYFLPALLFCLQPAAKGQKISPDLQAAGRWHLVNRTAAPETKDGAKGIRLSEAPGGGLMILKDVDLSDGTIELDIKGSHQIQQSFVGLAFHIQSPTAYDAVYFRPFNFKSDEAIRRSHAVQYISMPGNDWEKLRNQFPGKYEHAVDPAPDPDEWFHAKIVINKSHITVYVNNAKQPSLEVDKISTTTHGGLGLWVGNNSPGSFANLTFTAKNGSTAAQPNIPYGNNPEAGHYLDVGDAQLYYEIYGTGKPLVLLHGGVYGYIDEFEPFIQRLSKEYQVICVATRGHGKSSIGHTPFTWQQRAEDAYKVTRAVTKDSVIVLGFSDGGHGALKLAALHPELVKKLIAIGSGDYPESQRQHDDPYTPQMLMKSDSAFFAGRLALMPEPDRWAEDLAMLTKLYNDEFISAETFSKIKCPTLIMAGDRDQYNPIEAIIRCEKAIPNAQLSVIAGCSHVVFFCNFPAVWDAIEPFLKQMN